MKVLCIDLFLFPFFFSLNYLVTKKKIGGFPIEIYDYGASLVHDSLVLSN
jgi:hypothetical protein